MCCLVRGSRKVNNMDFACVSATFSPDMSSTCFMRRLNSLIIFFVSSGLLAVFCAIVPKSLQARPSILAKLGLKCWQSRLQAFHPSSGVASMIFLGSSTVKFANALHNCSVSVAAHAPLKFACPIAQSAVMSSECFSISSK